jgi:hypothetical protein
MEELTLTKGAAKRGRGKARGRDNRETESRKAEENPMPNMNFRGRLYIDPHLIPKTVVYEWKREATLGEYDENNMQDAMINGWRPVPADRHPELRPPALPGRPHTANEYIRRGGLILMEKAKEMVLAEKARLREENLAAMQAVDWAGELSENDSVMPAVDYGSKIGIEQVTATQRRGGFKE